VSNREKHLLSQIISCEEEKCKSPNNALVILSPSDIGVRRNLGRPGSAYAPKVILNTLKKVNNHFPSDFKILSKFLTSNISEKEDFEKAQQQQTIKMAELISLKKSKTIHIGGGHDHVFPFLCALESSTDYKNLVIINIDAHCDTRIDTRHHSGTPFRNFDEVSHKPFFLYQYGIHLESNNKDTMGELKKGKMYVSPKQTNPQNVMNEIKTQCPFKITNKTKVLISIDCDGFNASFMSAVSAVNLNGIELDHFLELLKLIKEFECQSIDLGIYEYNPLFEDLSLKGAKSITKIIIEYLK
jgi:formiminoglutamase